MKTALLILLSCLALVCLGQTFSRTPAFIGAAGSVSTSATFSPDSVSGLIGWWSADSGVYSDFGTTPCTDNTGVKQWNNRVTGGINLISGASSNSYFSNSVINGKPSIYFNATYLTNKWGSSKTQPVTVFFLHRYILTNTGYSIIMDGPSTGRIIFGSSSAGNIFNCYAGSDQSSAGILNNTWYYTTLVVNGASSSLRTNGVAATAFSGSPGVNASDGVYLGMRYSFDQFKYVGNISEILFYSGPLSDTDRNKVEAYLKKKYRL